MKDATDEHRIEAFKRVFGKLEDLIDINALFGFMVQKIGTKTFINPKTKKDPMLDVINLFVNPDI